jgi:hypothetical protein
MKNRVKLVVLCGLMAFPMMVAFQNCSRTVAMQMTDEISGKLDSDQLPNGISEVDQQNPNDGGSAPSGGDSVSQPVDNNLPSSDQPSGGDSVQQPSGSEPDSNMNTQVEDPNQELQDDVDAAAAECDYDANESQNDANGVLAGKSISHIRGSKILSAADFNGSSEVDQISDAYGKIVLCGLHVKSLSDTGGRIILVNSLVDDLSNHKGDIGILESRAIISDSKGKINKQNSDAPSAQSSHHGKPKALLIKK